MLGDWREANETLENITLLFRAHPDVLVLRWAPFTECSFTDRDALFTSLCAPRGNFFCPASLTRTKFARTENGMFVGTIDKNVVYSSHPVIVVEGVTVVGSFRTTQEAEGFVRGSRKFSAHIFRHDGQEWVSHAFEEINPLLVPKRARKPRLYN